MEYPNFKNGDFLHVLKFSSKYSIVSFIISFIFIVLSYDALYITEVPKCIKAINEADIIILGPGSLYTSIIPNLLVEGISFAIPVRYIGQLCEAVSPFDIDELTKLIIKNLEV